MENNAERTVKAGRPKKQTGPGRPKLRERSYRLAKQFAQRQKLENRSEWEQYCQGDKLPHDIPKRPDLVYKERWEGWQEWLGTKFVSYQEAKAIVLEHNYLNQEDYHNRYALVNRLVPKHPDRHYEDWEGWVQFFNREKQCRPAHPGNIDNLVLYQKATHYRPFMEAVKYIARQGLKDYPEWLKWRAKYQHDDIPWHPDEVYSEWCGWPIFLGHDPLPGLLENVAVLYVGKYPTDPDNVYRVDTCQLGRSDLMHKARQEGFKVYRMWKYDPTLKAEVKRAIELNCSHYYGSDTMFIVSNIHGLFSDLFSLLAVIS